MADIHEFPDVPGYVSIKQAAEMLGITDKRVYRYIDIGRLPAYKSGGVFLLAVKDVQQFKLRPPGRTRSVPPAWRNYHARSQVLVTEIRVPVRANQQANLREKLAIMQQEDRHRLPGTIARYIVKGNPELTELYLVLVWKDTEMLKEVEHQESLKALEAELAECLHWDAAECSTNEALIYT